MLITDAHLSFKPNGALEISFEDKSDPAQVRSCQLNLQVSLVHGMVHLIQQTKEKAHWGSESRTSQPTDPSPLMVQDPARYAH